MKRTSTAPVMPLWHSFRPERSAKTKKKAAEWLADNFVSATCKAPATYYALVEFICASAQRPVPVVSLCDKLKSKELIRGRVLFGALGNHLDEVATSFDDVGWWTTDAGLHMDILAPAAAVSTLPKFDRLAGKLTVDQWQQNSPKRNTHLSAEALQEIAAELDRAGFKLLNELQPKQKTALQNNHRLMASKGVKTFEQAAMHPKFVRMLRRRLYVARDRYREAAEVLIEHRCMPVPKIFWSHVPF